MREEEKVDLEDESGIPVEEEMKAVTIYSYEGRYSQVQKVLDFEDFLSLMRDNKLARNSEPLAGLKQLLREKREEFNIFDEDGSNSITPAELHDFFCRCPGMRPTHYEVLHMVEKVDRDGDLEVGFAEFVQMLHIKERKKNSAAGKLQSLLRRYREWFNLFDLNKNGSVPLIEFNYFMTSAGNPMSAEELRELDNDGNGYIEFHEFVNAMMAGGSESKVIYSLILTLTPTLTLIVFQRSYRCKKRSKPKSQNYMTYLISSTPPYAQTVESG